MVKFYLVRLKPFENRLNHAQFVGIQLVIPQEVRGMPTADRALWSLVLRRLPPPKPKGTGGEEARPVP